MPRYYFNLKSPSRPVGDKTGVELPGLEAAHWHAMRLVYRLREHAAETGEDWVIAVADESGDATLVLLPRAVPMLREPTAPPRHLISSSSPLGGEGFPPRSGEARRLAERVRGSERR